MEQDVYGNLSSQAMKVDGQFFLRINNSTRPAKKMTNKSVRARIRGSMGHELNAAGLRRTPPSRADTDTNAMQLHQDWMESDR